MNPFELPGLSFAGYIRADNINHGVPIPLFNPAPPPDGRASINTLEGWTAAADKQNRKSFKAVHGREPADNAELDAWVETLKSSHG